MMDLVACVRKARPIIWQSDQNTDHFSGRCERNGAFRDTTHCRIFSIRYGASDPGRDIEPDVKVLL